MKEVVQFMSTSPSLKIGELHAILESAQARRARALNETKGALGAFRSYAYAIDPGRQPCIIRARSQLYLEMFNRSWYEPEPHYASTLDCLAEASKAIETYMRVLDQHVPRIDEGIVDLDRLARRGAMLLDHPEQYIALDVRERLDKLYSSRDEFESALARIWSSRMPAIEAKEHVDAASLLTKSSYELFKETRKAPRSLGDIEQSINQAIVLLNA